MVLETKPHQNRNSVRPASADMKHFRHHRNPLRTVVACKQLLARDSMLHSIINILWSVFNIGP